MWDNSNLQGDIQWGNIQLPGISDEELLTKNWAKADSNRLASMVFKSKEQAAEIFNRCWGPDRGEKLYKKLAEEYGVSMAGIIDLVRGVGHKRHAYCPVSSNELKKLKQEWEEKYKTRTYIVNTPGNDLLEYYDELFIKAPIRTEWRRNFPPSLVFHCRFNIRKPTPETVRDYCDSLGIERKFNDLRVYKSILNQQTSVTDADYFNWLVNKPSKQYRFNSLEEVAKFLTKHKENKKHIEYTSTSASAKFRECDGIVWRTKNSFAGWTFIIEE